jgi:hypothetical protein
MMKITCKKSDDIDDWYTIEKAEHDNYYGLHEIAENCSSVYWSGRIADTDVEGSLYEMREVAEAIRDKRSISFKRIGIIFSKDEETVFFYSPRNSRMAAMINIDEANELAAEIIKIAG